MFSSDNCRCSDAGALLDKDIIRDEVLNMLVAGRDTVCEVSSHLNSLIQPIFQTAATLTYAVYMLAEHPTMADRLRNEILDKVGASKVPTHDDIKAMPYLRAFINGSTKYSDMGCVFQF